MKRFVKLNFLNYRVSSAVDIDELGAVVCDYV